MWDLLHLLDLGPLETDPIIQVFFKLGSPFLNLNPKLLVDQLGDKLKDSSGPAFILEPKRNIDANILWLKLKHRSTN